MISEIAFATQHTSLWHILAPNSERFVRRLNLNLDRYALEQKFSDSPGRRGFLNEIAFQKAKMNHLDCENSLTNAIELARQHLSLFDKSHSGDLSDPHPSEADIILAIGESIKEFVRQERKEGDAVVFEPLFPGCGFLDASIGDLLIGDALFEVKAGDRLFRSTDLRQLVTYCAMNFAGGAFGIRRAGCINPRRGTYFVLELDVIAQEMAGKSSPELFSEIVYHLSTSGISR